jgi:activator of HSP90 ATPase
MNDHNESLNTALESVGAPTRRQVLAGAAVGLASLGSATSVLSRAVRFERQAEDPVPKKLLTALRQEVTIDASPSRIYKALLSSKQFAAFTGMAAKIDDKPGGAFTMFGGLILGRNVELVPDKRIVQAWRPANWNPGVYSIVKFELMADGPKTTLVLDHTGFPTGEYDSLSSGWETHYWAPIKKFLS